MILIERKQLLFLPLALKSVSDGSMKNVAYKDFIPQIR